VPQGRLDENGLEEMSGLFSSPRKQSPVKRHVNGLNGISENSMLEVSEAMTGMDSMCRTAKAASPKRVLLCWIISST
jgi:hypothetical protein